MSVRSLWYSLDYPFTSPGIRRPALQVYIREWLMWQFLSLGLFSWLSTMLPPQLNLTSNGGWNLHSWRLFFVSYCVIGLCILSVHDLSCFWRACVHLSIIFSPLFSPFSSYRPWSLMFPCFTVFHFSTSKATSAINSPSPTNYCKYDDLSDHGHVLSAASIESNTHYIVIIWIRRL